MLPKLHLNYSKACIMVAISGFFFGGCVFSVLFDALRAGNMLSNKAKALICILGAKKQSEL